jgi:ADP-ribosylglycohydrolase
MNEMIGKRDRKSPAHFAGCLLGGAVGDALGAPVEFHSIQLICNKYGSAGITDYDTAYGRRGAITDDTQMTLFSKGCGGVMRVAPIGLIAENEERAFSLGCAAAAITHGHPSGYYSAGCFAAIIWRLAELELRVEIEAVAGDLFKQFEDTDAWRQRYPGW